jgi:DNA polymerase-3 subunit delta'
VSRSVPAPFESTFDVIGARAPLEFFGAMDPARLAHGYIFSGPPGSGKKTFARRLAKSLLCDRRKATLLGYCNECAACTLFDAATHPDFVESNGDVKIGESGETSEDLTARELVRFFSLHGYLSAHRILLLGDIKFSTPAAPNALLKFFEEPPPGFFVLITTSSPGSLLATIRSRLSEIAFPPLTGGEVAMILQRQGVAAADANRVAPLALGDANRGRELLEDGAADIRGAALAWFGAVLEGRTHDLRLDERGESAGERRDALAGILEHIRIIARDWAVTCIAGPGAPLLAADLRSEIARLPRRTPEQAAAVLHAVSETQLMSRTNVSSSFVADYLRVRITP